MDRNWREIVIFWWQNQSKTTHSSRLQCIDLFTWKYIFISQHKVTLAHDFQTDDLYVNVPPLILWLKNTDYMHNEISVTELYSGLVLQEFKV